MNKHNQDGTVSGIALSLGVTVVLLVVSLIFGFWAFGSRQDYKNNTDAKIATAVQAATIQESATKDAAFAQSSKYPLATYNGPEAYGSIVVQYPKTWSGYVNDTGQGSALVDAYFDPGVVPSLTDQNSVFALRVQVINQSYSQTLQSISNQAGTSVSAYSLPKVPSAVGVEISGQLPNQVNGTMVILPVRANTIEIWTQGSTYLSDFNSNILPNFSFSP